MDTPIRPRAVRRRVQSAALGVLLAASTASAQVTVNDAWVRASVPAQKTSGAYMTITSRDAARLVGASSQVAAVAEIHETRFQNDIARMRPVRAIALPAGRPVQLKPGGYHLMLLDLKRQLKAGESVPIVLQVEDASGKPVNVAVNARVAGAASGATPNAEHPAHGH